MSFAATTALRRLVPRAAPRALAAPRTNDAPAAAGPGPTSRANLGHFKPQPVHEVLGTCLRDDHVGLDDVPRGEGLAVGVGVQTSLGTVTDARRATCLYRRAPRGVACPRSSLATEPSAHEVVACADFGLRRSERRKTRGGRVDAPRCNRRAAGVTRQPGAILGFPGAY